MPEIFIVIAVAVTLSIGLHLCVVTGCAACFAADYRLGGSSPADTAALALRSLGIACGIAGVAFRLPALTILGIAMIGIYVTMTAKRLATVPTHFEIPLIAVSFLAAAPLTMLRTLAGT